MAKSLMLVGTASDVGKSVLCTAFCRIFHQDGYKVAPFKAQNMSLNSAATPAGGEIGRAQAAQAEACGIAPNEHMNPVLLKPSGHMQSQVVLQGKVLRNVSAARYFTDEKPEIWHAVKESYGILSEQYEIVVMEGAGSPVEMNLKSRDIANMRAAEMADAAVLLVADIDRGGVFASVVGTMQLLPPEEKSRVKGVLINKFRGDPALFEEGIAMMEQLAGVPVLGVIPYLDPLYIDEEDSVALDSPRYRRKRRGDASCIRIGIIRFPHLANYTDLDPLFGEHGVDAFFCREPEELKEADAVILPGSKNTIEDLAWFGRQGWREAILQAARDGKRILGICGGYQMMGTRVCDPLHIESDAVERQGLGLWEAKTVLAGEKTTVPVTAVLAEHEGSNWRGRVTGYEIHMGKTRHFGLYQPFARIEERRGCDEGRISSNGKWIGTYLHGILHNDDFRKAWINDIRTSQGLPEIPEVVAYDRLRQEACDHLAAQVRSQVDMARIYDALFQR